jgi:hypothetical protein
MCGGSEKEIELVRKKLFEAGITSETRRHPMAASLGVSGLELWVQNERDLFNASRLYTRLQQESAISQEPPTETPKAGTFGAPASRPQPQVESSGSSPKEVGRIDAAPVGDHRLELQETSSLLQKGIEAILVRERELTGECATLHGKVEELTGALTKAQADAAREIKSREAAAAEQAEQLKRILDTLARERRESQEKLKVSDDSLKNAKEQVASFSRQLQTQQAAAAVLRQQITGLELQREQQERSLSEARQATATEREARIAAEERAGVAEHSLQTQSTEHQELERQIQAHAANLGSLLARVTSKAAATGGNS